jgi:hypothetical protein
MQRLEFSGAVRPLSVLHYNKTYLLNNDIPVRVDFLGLYKVSVVIAVPSKAFLAVRCLKVSKGIHQFC